MNTRPLPSQLPDTRNALAVENLAVGTQHRELVHGISLHVGAGERVALIGESGSGKTLTAAAIMGLLPENLHASGQVAIGPVHDALALSDNELSRYRGTLVSMVFQEPMTALDPLMRVGKQLEEAISLHSSGGGGLPLRGNPSGLPLPPLRGDSPPATPPSLSQITIKARAQAALTEVGLPPETYRAYPHQLSGGQRQRVLIAMALVNQPRFLIADEPTTALDVTVQAQILDLIGELVIARQMGLLFITHDLGVVARIAERVYVMKDGNIVETGNTRDVLTHPQQAYTQQLVAASDLAKLQLTNPGESHPTNSQPIIKLTNVTKTYSRAGGLFRSQTEVNALRGITFDIAAGERFGIVGESGSGKSTTLRLIAGLDTATSGEVQVLGENLAAVPKQPAAAVKQVRSQVQLVFQDPNNSLNPRMRVGNIVAEPLLHPLIHERIPAAATKEGRAQLVAEMLESVGLSPACAKQYPHEFSGGQRQRISIARALISQPKILIADEPVSALDVSVRAQVLQLLSDQAAQRELTLVLVSHDLSIIEHLCDRVAVFHNGVIVEQGPTKAIWANPQHEYTRQLQAAAL